MNPFANELAKAAAPELAKTTENFIQRLFGPIADEAGQMLAEQVRLRRLGASLKIVERAREMVVGADLEAKSVPLKVLVPLLEGASLEENEDLQEKWAALLANAATIEEGVLPGFVEVLRQISVPESKLLDALTNMFDVFASVPIDEERLSQIHTLVFDVAGSDLKGSSTQQIDLIVSASVRNGVLRYRPSMLAHNPKTDIFPTYIIEIPRHGHLPLSIQVAEFGLAFVRACRAPSP